MKSVFSAIVAVGLVLGSASLARAQVRITVGNGYTGTGVSVVAGAPAFGYGPGYGYGVPAVRYFGLGYPVVAAPVAAPVYVAPVNPFYAYPPFGYRPVVAPLYPVGVNRPFPGLVPIYGPQPRVLYRPYGPFLGW